MPEASRKVEGGKMVKLSVEDDRVSVTGDFFMHPEEEVAGVEDVVAEHVDAEVDEIEEAVEGYLSGNDVELLGVSTRDIAELAVEARG